MFFTPTSFPFPSLKNRIKFKPSKDVALSGCIYIYICIQILDLNIFFSLFFVVKLTSTQRLVLPEHWDHRLNSLIFLLYFPILSIVMLIVICMTDKFLSFSFLINLVSWKEILDICSSPPPPFPSLKYIYIYIYIYIYMHPDSRLEYIFQFVLCCAINLHTTISSPGALGSSSEFINIPVIFPHSFYCYANCNLYDRQISFILFFN